MTVLTDEDSAFSEVLLAKDKVWIGKLGAPSNSAMVSGNPVTLVVADLQDDRQTHGHATLRNAAKPLYPELKACETANWSKTGTDAPARGADLKPATGWEGRMGPSLVLLTKSAAYFYYESCDICADIARCDLATGQVTQFAAAHSLDCGDLKAPRSQPDIVFDACAPRKP